jgi:enamine deaminase RidA (YjgF/YER057c/UK114 family)
MMLAAAVLGLALWPAVALAQFGGGFGGRGGRGGGGGEGFGRGAAPAPKMPDSELDGPADSATAREVMSLTDPQAARYAQAYDSFMVATRPQRDSAQVATGKMNDRLDSGDRAAAEFYAERIQDLGRELKDRQAKFEDNLRHFLSGDQMKAYRHWREEQDQAAEKKNREAALRWRGGGERMGGMGMGVVQPEQRSFPRSPSGVAAPDLGSQAVRVGRALYVATQLSVDSTGGLVAPGDLHAQAVRAFANLGAVLRSAGVWPQDVVALTIYVVDYSPAQVGVIRDAGAAYFGMFPPVVTVLGVQSLSRDGALIGVGATAVSSVGGFAGASARDR